jgi:hypothetical protein
MASSHNETPDLAAPQTTTQATRAGRVSAQTALPTIAAEVIAVATTGIMRVVDRWQHCGPPTR